MGIFKKRTNVEEAKKLFLGRINPTRETEEILIEDSVDRVLSEEIVANRDVPHYRRAAMDGYAVISRDTLGATPNSPVFLRLKEKIDPGACIWVHTGSPLPGGTDSVVMVEDTSLKDNLVEVRAQTYPLKNVGERGEDIREGETVLTEGHQLRPCDIAVIASLGVNKVSVYKQPLVAIIPTGEELVPREIGREPGPGETIETNSLMVGLYVKNWGGIPRNTNIVGDSIEEIKEAVESNLDADMLIICGGTSVGKRDHVPEMVRSLGTLLVHGIAVSPGKPTGLGVIGGKPVICLPGYPVAGLIALYLFARPGLRRMAHIPERPDTRVRAVLGDKIASRIGYQTFARVKLRNGTAQPLMTSGAGILSSVAKADGFVIVPENIEGYQEGEEVDVILIE